MSTCMRPRLSPPVIVLVGLAAAILPACAFHPPEPIAEAQVLGGESIDVATLNRGRQAYAHYCRACHGDRGDGRGPAASGLATPPRDFRIATFKFMGTPTGYLPHDEDIERVVEAGLHGTAMMPWQIPPPMLRDIIQYIKTFSPPGEGFRDPSAERTARIEPGEDPWAGRRDDALARGRDVYHGSGSCWSCHPSYRTLEGVNEARARTGMAPIAELRPNAWLPEAKPSDAYRVPVAGDPACERDGDCGDEEVCAFGRCEAKHRILPPDFTVNTLRAGRSPSDLYRIIAAGVPGTAMPTWDGSLPREDIWAIAHFVDHLRESGIAEGRRLKEPLRSAAAAAATAPAATLTIAPAP